MKSNVTNNPFLRAFEIDRLRLYDTPAERMPVRPLEGLHRGTAWWEDGEMEESNFLTQNARVRQFAFHAVCGSSTARAARQKANNVHVSSYERIAQEIREGTRRTAEMSKTTTMKKNNPTKGDDDTTVGAPPPVAAAGISTRLQEVEAAFAHKEALQSEILESAQLSFERRLFLYRERQDQCRMQTPLIAGSTVPAVALLPLYLTESSAQLKTLFGRSKPRKRKECLGKT